MEIGRFMEAGRIGVGGLPGKVPDGLVGCVIDPQNVDQVSCLGCSSADDGPARSLPAASAVEQG